MLALRADGLPVVGYTWFPLFDLFDWSYRTGTAPPADYLEQLGLVRLVADPGSSWSRRPTPAFERFRELARTHGARSEPVPAMDAMVA